MVSPYDKVMKNVEWFKSRCLRILTKLFLICRPEFEKWYHNCIDNNFWKNFKPLETGRWLLLQCSLLLNTSKPCEMVNIEQIVIYIQSHKKIVLSLLLMFRLYSSHLQMQLLACYNLNLIEQNDFNYDVRLREIFEKKYSRSSERQYWYFEVTQKKPIQYILIKKT